MLQFRKYQPAKDLAEYVHSYFVIEFDGKKALKDSIEEAEKYRTNHPQGTVDLMFAVRGGINLANFKDDEFQLSKIFVMAQQEGYFKIKFNPGSFIVGIVFYSEGFAKLFNFPMAELTNKGRNVEQELSEDYHVFHDQLSSIAKEEQIILGLNEFIRKQLSKVDFSFTKFDMLIRQIRDGQGSDKIPFLADQANMSERSLQRKMKSITGVSPKSYSKIVRFKSVLELIEGSTELDWQDILYQAGYFDQAHFIKDFKLYTGSTPSDFIKEDDDLSKRFLGD